jgi:hypothetical protein
MNNSLFFILLLFAGISCSEPNVKDEFGDIYDSMVEQKHLYYNVKHTVYNSENETPLANIYGLVKLNRNSDSGISSAYFGLEAHYLPNYLNSIYLENNCVFNISSNIFDLNSADIIMDSLHSPILINADLLYEIEKDSLNIKRKVINNNTIKITFDLKKKANQLVLFWDNEIGKITELEYKYNLGTEHFYSRKWSFDYLSKSDYLTLESQYKHQNQIAHQPFL